MTVVVVPIPRFSCSASVRSKIAPLAWRIAVRSREAASPSGSPRRLPSSREMILTAISLATSPAAWPPIPSATMKRPCAQSRRKLSSLPDRTTPTSVLPAQVIRMPDSAKEEGARDQEHDDDDHEHRNDRPARTALRGRRPRLAAGRRRPPPREPWRGGGRSGGRPPATTTPPPTPPRVLVAAGAPAQPPPR